MEQVNDHIRYHYHLTHPLIIFTSLFQISIFDFSPFAKNHVDTHFVMDLPLFCYPTHPSSTPHPSLVPWVSLPKTIQNHSTLHLIFGPQPSPKHGIHSPLLPPYLISLPITHPLIRALPLTAPTSRPAPNLPHPLPHPSFSTNLRIHYYLNTMVRSCPSCLMILSMTSPSAP